MEAPTAEGFFSGLLVADLERLWDKYRVSLKKTEERRADATAKLDGYLMELGYA